MTGIAELWKAELFETIARVANSLGANIKPSNFKLGENEREYFISPWTSVDILAEQVEMKAIAYSMNVEVGWEWEKLSEMFHENKHLQRRLIDIRQKYDIGNPQDSWLATSWNFKNLVAFWNAIEALIQPAPQSEIVFGTALPTVEPVLGKKAFDIIEIVEYLYKQEGMSHQAKPTVHKWKNRYYVKNTADIEHHIVNKYISKNTDANKNVRSYRVAHGMDDMSESPQASTLEGLYLYWHGLATAVAATEPPNEIVFETKAMKTSPVVIEDHWFYIVNERPKGRGISNVDEMEKMFCKEKTFTVSPKGIPQFSPLELKDHWKPLWNDIIFFYRRVSRRAFFQVDLTRVLYKGEETEITPDGLVGYQQTEIVFEASFKKNLINVIRDFTGITYTIRQREEGDEKSYTIESAFDVYKFLEKWSKEQRLLLDKEIEAASLDGFYVDAKKESAPWDMNKYRQRFYVDYENGEYGHSTLVSAVGTTEDLLTYWTHVRNLLQRQDTEIVFTVGDIAPRIGKIVSILNEIRHKMKVAGRKMFILNREQFTICKEDTDYFQWLASDPDPYKDSIRTTEILSKFETAALDMAGFDEGTRASRMPYQHGGGQRRELLDNFHEKYNVHVAHILPFSKDLKALHDYWAMINDRMTPMATEIVYSVGTGRAEASQKILLMVYDLAEKVEMHGLEFNVTLEPHDEVRINSKSGLFKLDEMEKRVLGGNTEVTITRTRFHIDASTWTIQGKPDDIVAYLNYLHSRLPSMNQEIVLYSAGRGSHGDLIDIIKDCILIANDMDIDIRLGKENVDYKDIKRNPVGIALDTPVLIGPRKNMSLLRPGQVVNDKEKIVGCAYLIGIEERCASMLGKSKDDLRREFNVYEESAACSMGTVDELTIYWSHLHNVLSGAGTASEIVV